MILRTLLRAATSLALAGLLLGAQLGAAQDEKVKTPQTVEELEQAIRAVLRKTHTPAASVALVSRDQVLWTAGLGRADVAAKKPAGPETVFRVGSISKTFVSLSVLKLVEQGRLRLDAPVRELAPEIQFTNRWEPSQPVRVVNLLEHTTGFDDIHLCEYAYQGPHLTLRQGLDFHPHSRTTRWPPGQHFSYCNAGPTLAAYIVEKITGQRYEDFVQENFFNPLDMKTASFFLSDAVRANLAKSYGDDGRTEVPFWHISVRPSGAVSAPPGEMAHLVQFLLNRGAYNGQALLTPASIERMETPASTLGARAGLRVGYSLGNYSSFENGFLFHGHDGGIEGFVSSYGYLPESGLGYFYSINADNGPAFEEIGKLVRAYLTRALPKPTLPPVASVAAERLQLLAGYYEPITPRLELTRALDALLGIRRVDAQGNKLAVSSLFGERRDLFPVTDTEFRGDQDSQATVVFLNEPEGRLVEGWSRGLNGTFRSLSATQVWSRRLLAAATLLLMVSSVAFALVWVPLKLLGRLRGVQHLSVRALPLLAALCCVAMFAVVIVGFSGANFIETFGRPSLWSWSFFLLTVLFAALTVAGLVHVLRARGWEIRRAVWIHSLLVSLANTVMLLYLSYGGFIGLRTWSQ